MPKVKLLLASQSIFRRKMLEDAGVPFTSFKPDFKERELEKEITVACPEDLALQLACAKALASEQSYHRRHTSQANSHLAAQTEESGGIYILAADQTLLFRGEILHKSRDLASLREKLQALSGNSHYLYSAYAIACRGQIVAKSCSIACLTMRSLPEDFLDKYIAQGGEALLQSSGGYQIEKAGISLFDKIEGDYFSIIGLPLLDVLKSLRHLGIID